MGKKESTPLLKVSHSNEEGQGFAKGSTMFPKHSFGVASVQSLPVHRLSIQEERIVRGVKLIFSV